VFKPPDNGPVVFVFGGNINIARIRGAHRASAGESDGNPFMTLRLKQAKPPAHLVDYNPC